VATTHRNLRAPGHIWTPCLDRAAERGDSGAAVIRSAMRAYTAGLLDDVLAPFIATDAEALAGPPAGDEQAQHPPLPLDL
jgi:hypothetical protein